MTPGGRQLRGEAGMTLVELMVGSLILVAGMLGVLGLVDTANGIAGENRARVAATNLGREVFEAARGVPYEELTPAGIGPALKARPGLGGGDPWVITRRGVAYTVRAEVCTLDDPKDGLADGTTVRPPDFPCPPAAAVAGAPVEANPDDFARVDVTLRWSLRGKERSLKMTTLIVNPSGGLGPRIKPPMPEPAGQVTGGTTVTLSPVLTTANASSMHWTVDNLATEGDATGGPTSWVISWPIGTVGTAPYVYDGTYTVGAQPFDSRGVPGDTKSSIVQINRALPLKAKGLVGGRNEAHASTVVDLEWDGNPERDVLGYRVYRTTSTDTALVCGGTTQPLNALSCTDTAAPSTGSLSYRVVAVDRADLASATSALREGTPSAVLDVPAAGARPSRPTGLTVTIANGLPHLEWTPPATGTVAFYRIYRDGTAVSDRIARTASAAAYFDDSTWGETGHTYRVAAVGPSFNESDLSDPVTLSYP